MVVISAILCGVLLLSTLYIANTTSTIESSHSSKSFDLKTSSKFSLAQKSSSNNISSLNNDDLANSPFTNTKAFPENKSTGQQFVDLFINTIAEIINGDSMSNIMKSNVISPEILDGNADYDPGGNSSGDNYYKMMAGSSLTESQMDDIQMYSNGKTPDELIDNFCGQARSGELDRMAEDIRQSYNYDPASPAALMSVFEKMGDLCPE